MADLQKLLEDLQNFDINDVDRIGVWPLPVKIIICVALAGIIVSLGYFLFVKDKNMQLQSARSQETTLRKSFESKAFEAANLAAYREQMTQMEESFGALVARLPSDTEVPGLLEDIDDKGLDSRLSIDSISLQPEVTAEFYVELPIKINVSGGYHEFGSFISGVAGMPRIVTLHGFNIERDGQSSNLSMEILAKTYRYKAQED